VRLGVEAALVDGQLVPGDLEVIGGRVAGFGLSSPNGHGIAVPGFVDLQVNGFGGVDFLGADAEGYRQAGDALLETGVTAYLPTFITSPEEQLLAALREVPAKSDGPRVLGAHLEGPFLSALRLGIHPAAARSNPDLGLEKSAEKPTSAGGIHSPSISTIARCTNTGSIDGRCDSRAATGSPNAIGCTFENTEAKAMPSATSRNGVAQGSARIAVVRIRNSLANTPNGGMPRIASVPIMSPQPISGLCVIRPRMPSMSCVRHA